MSRIKLNGAPTNKTPGAVGDIYIDMETGLEYRCTFAYRDPFFKTLDCEWKLTGEKYNKYAGPSTDIDRDIPEEVKEKVVEKVKEPVKSEKPKYVNYSQHSKKAK